MKTTATDIQNAVSLMSGGDKGKAKPIPSKTPSPLDNADQDEYQKFGNWLNDTNTKNFAKDLMNRGLKGADQIYYDNPDTKTHNGVINAQSDWKINAIQQILANAKKYNIRTPEAANANRHLLIGNSRWSDAIDNPAFNDIHSNWWDVITKSILPEQWKKYDAQNKNNVASNTK